MVSVVIISTRNADTDNSMTCRTPVSLDGDLGHSHFALISIDVEGSLHLQCSRSVAKTFQGSLSAQLADALTKAVTKSGEVCSAIDQCRFHINCAGVRSNNDCSSTLWRPSITSPNTKFPTSWSTSANSRVHSYAFVSLGHTELETDKKKCLERSQQNVAAGSHHIYQKP